MVLRLLAISCTDSYDRPMLFEILSFFKALREESIWLN